MPHALLLSAAMKIFLPILAIVMLAGCNSNMATHNKDFTSPKGKGEWTDYYQAARNREAYEPKKELKDR